MLATAALRVLVIVLVTLLSGAPRALASAVVGGEPPCATPCDGDERDESHDDESDVCPPLCSTGPCAKVFPSLPTTAFVELELTLAASSDFSPMNTTADVPDGVSESVFHPPRA